MEYQYFRKINLLIVAIFAAIIAISVVTDNWILAAISITAMLAIILTLKKQVRVKGVINDERDYANAGKAARMAVSVFSVCGAITGLVLIFLHHSTIGSLVSNSVCVLLLIQSAFYFYYEKQN